MFFSLNQVFLFCFVLLKTASSAPQLYKHKECVKYIVETEQKYNYDEATHECVRNGAHLVEIHSAEKNAIVIDLLKDILGNFYKNFWLGANDEFNSIEDFNRTFVWTTTGKRMNFTYWSCENPDNDEYQEHCTHIYDDSVDYKWNDGNCLREMGFICEYDDFC